MDDAGIAGLLASVTTGMIRLIRPDRVQGRFALGTMVALCAAFGLLNWGAGVWHVVESARNAAVAMVGSIATGLGVYESYQHKKDEATE